MSTALRSILLFVAAATVLPVAALAQITTHTFRVDSTVHDTWWSSTSNPNRRVGADVTIKFDYSVGTIGSGVAKLTFDITNLGPADGFNRSDLTGFGFNLPANFGSPSFSYSLLTPGEPGGIGFGQKANYSVSYGGTFDRGVRLSYGGTNYSEHSGGDPRYGLRSGFTTRFVFSFNVTGSNKDVFEDHFNVAAFFAGTDPEMVFRFRDVKTPLPNKPTSFDTLNAKVVVSEQFGGGEEVPEPSTYGILGALLLAGLVVRRRWHQRQESR
jgi:hypothetical protein